jgi:hypothetical protein
MAYDRIRTLTAAYTVIGFADTEARAQFALGSTDDREEMIWETVERGYVKNNKEHMIEVLT